MRSQNRAGYPQAVLIVGIGLVLALSVGRNQTVSATQFTDWSMPVNLGATVNSAFNDFAPHISSDGLSLYFASNRPETLGKEDLWVSERPSRDADWGAPRNLGVAINTAEFDERSPALSLNGHLLFFATNRTGGYGGLDIWISWRADTHDNFAWQPPVNLGTGINSGATDAGPSFFESGLWTDGSRWHRTIGIPLLFMASSRPGGAGGLDIYVGTVPGGWFGPPVLVAELSTPNADLTPTIRRDGLEIVIASDRAGTVGMQDLWVSTRRSVHHRWSTPENLGPLVNSDSNDNFPSLSSNAASLYFNSNRLGGFGGSDLYVTTRER